MYTPPVIRLDMEMVAACIPENSGLHVLQCIWIDEKSWCILLGSDEQVFRFSRWQQDLRKLLATLRSRISSDHADFLELFSICTHKPDAVKNTLKQLRSFGKSGIFISRTEYALIEQQSGRFRNTADACHDLRQHIQVLEEAVNFGNAEKVEQCFAELRRIYSEPAFSYRDFWPICNGLLDLLTWLLEKNALPTLQLLAQQNAETLLRITNAEQIWQWLKDCFSRLASLEDPAMSKPMNRKIQQSVEYIHKNYGQKLTAKLVGEQVGLSEVYFSNLFKKDVGQTFGDYLTAYRLRVAKYLLSTGEYKIYEISERTGYSSPQYFSQLFHRETGCTPMEYMNMSQRRAPDDTK